MAECFSFGSETREDKTFTVTGYPFPLSNLFSSLSVENALTLRPQPCDVILSSYPKCDSKTIDSIVWKILYMDLKHPPVCSTTNRFLPCMEMTTIDDLSPVYEYISRHRLPKLYKTCLPFKLIPFYKRAKYIYVVRTPWEACASYYVFLCLLNYITDSFDVFLNDFLHGKVPYGSYFKHIMPWNKKINESNVLILCREHVEHNPRSAMFTIAAFLGDRYLSQLMNNTEMEENILSATNWDKFRNNKYVLKSCFAHSYVKCTNFQCDGRMVRSQMKPICTESQLKEITDIVSSKFKDTSIEFMWLSLLKKQSPVLFV